MNRILNISNFCKKSGWWGGSGIAFNPHSSDDNLLPVIILVNPADYIPQNGWWVLQPSSYASHDVYHCSYL
jgi:hypothetical protein